jgi:hypothetical protein
MWMIRLGAALLSVLLISVTIWIVENVFNFDGGQALKLIVAIISILAGTVAMEPIAKRIRMTREADDD